MGWWIFFIGATAALIWVVVYFYRQDRNYLRSRTREALSPQVKSEIDAEIEAAKSRQEKFQKALKDAARNAKTHDNTLT